MSALVEWVTNATAKRDWQKLGLAYGSVVIALIIGHQFLRLSIVEKVYPETLTMTKVKLMEHEKEIMAMMPAVTTITTYKATRIPETFLKRKLADILRKNPWLCGRLLKNATDGLHLAYPGEFNTAEAINKLIKEHLQVVVDFEMPENIPYDELMKLVDHFQVQKGNNCINKPYALLFRVTLLKLKGRNEIALIVSMSHVIADGYTYYKVLNMFDKDAKVTALKAERSDQYLPGVTKLVGKPMIDWVHSPLVLAGLLGCALVRSAMKVHIVRVDNAWLAAQKADFLSEKSYTSKAKVPFVSTNDILTAWHCRISGCDIALMSLNARNRVPSFTDDMAGNYETSVMYNTPEDCHSASAIRASLDTYRNASGTVPGVVKTLAWNTTIVTNWSTFYKAVDISDAHNKAPCEYLRHLPIADASDLAVWREGAVVFKLDATHTGLLVATRTLSAQQLEATGVGRVLRTL
jgi:hypothetical protein